MFRLLPHTHPNSRLGALDPARSNSLLNAFVGWVNSYCHDQGRTDSIPDMDGSTWRLSSRQFRRTLAWHIARRSGGAIAGATQYRHLTIQMFEGYAGTSESGIRAEVEAEQAMARGEHLLAMTTDHDHHQLVGPAAREGGQRLDQFADRARFHGAVLNDPRRITRLMRRRDPDIHPGDYVTCVFDPEKALCLQRRDSRNRPWPTPTSCQPLECRNVALTPANLATLRDELIQLDAELTRRPTLPPLLLSRLTDRREKITTFLAPHATQETP